MLQEYRINGVPAGEFYEDDDIFVFFGQKRVEREDLTGLFPQFEFRFIKQTHGDVCAPCSVTEIEADAHWTQEKGLALAVQTADCLPVLIYAPEEKKIAAIHAGWRGVANEIVIKSVSKFGTPSKAKAWIGPHIRLQSFEVGQEVAEQFQAPIHRVQALDVIHSHPASSEKRLVDLTHLARHQLRHGKVERIQSSAVDTARDERYHSWRRDRTRGRQWSWIGMKR